MFSRTALIVTICYAGLVGASLIAAWRVTDFEGRAFDLLFIGFPWALVFPSDLYVVAVAMNIATAYILVVAIVKAFAKADG